MEKKKIGRKGLYQEWLKPDKLTLLRDWARNGLTDVEICKKIGISHDCFYRWKKDYKEFDEALKKTREIVDSEVEESLYKKAMGFSTILKKSIKCKKVYYDEEGRRCEEEILKEGFEEQYIPPDVTAQIFWLKNKRGETWREKQPEEQDESVAMLLTNVVNAMRAIRTEEIKKEKNDEE